MPYRYYHGRTGKIFHVVKRAVGVLVNKRVRHRIMVKRNALQVLSWTNWEDFSCREA